MKVGGMHPIVSLVSSPEDLEQVDEAPALIPRQCCELRVGWAEGIVGEAMKDRKDHQVDVRTRLVGEAVQLLKCLPGLAPAGIIGVEVAIPADGLLRDPAL